MVKAGLPFVASILCIWWGTHISVSFYTAQNSMST